MNLTNVKNLPQPLVDVVRKDLEIDRKLPLGCFTVTQLLQPAQILRLSNDEPDSLTSDVSEHIYALMGKMTHKLLEEADTSAVKEKRLYATLDHPEHGCISISGQFDRLCLIESVLQDWKTMSVWEHIFGMRPDRIAQLNMYRWLAVSNGIAIRKLQAVGLFRDWRFSELKRRGEDYPSKQVEVYDIEIWEMSEVENFILERIGEHMSQTVSECTAEDQWYSGDTFAVHMMGAKRATKLFRSADGYSKEDAQAWALKNSNRGKIFEVHVRRGEYKRCQDRGDGLSYCPVSKICPQWKRICESSGNG